MRKAVLSDFIKEDININNKSHQVDKIKTFRQQEEHGEKKFIKPWRTGTKSQQLPPKGNLKKNRGNK